MSKAHYDRLEQMFHSAPIQNMLIGAEMSVEERKAIYSLNISKDYFHAAEALHGAIYFKLLDDAAYFAAASIESTYFLLTKSYTIHFKRPVEVDQLTATGEVVSENEKEIVSMSRIVNSAGKIVAEGEGLFVRSRKLLVDQVGYR
ncbi:PaaI family thioesterase [Roseivirga sp. E12]|uniref:PaaI family thioesterase n=1 Tax=Roseivirga sp. E12 TaxID=2819237 RepID=UPI001ABC871F|nr:PaaI family thioesterase [Roseivirga sp. E12]MBO3698993.1 PaaI family thioesterase [Roseivirga sp. E12]